MRSRGYHHQKNGSMYGATVLNHTWRSACSSKCAAEPSSRGLSREQQGISTENRDAHLILDAAFWNGLSGVQHVRRRVVEDGCQSAKCRADQDRERAGSTCALGEKTIMQMFPQPVSYSLKFACEYPRTLSRSTFLRKAACTCTPSSSRIVRNASSASNKSSTTRTLSPLRAFESSGSLGRFKPSGVGLFGSQRRNRAPCPKPEDSASMRPPCIFVNCLPARGRSLLVRHDRVFPRFVLAEHVKYYRQEVRRNALPGVRNLMQMNSSSCESVTPIRPLRGVNFSALRTRSQSICSRRTASARMVTGTSTPDNDRSMPLIAASAALASTTDCTATEMSNKPEWTAHVPDHRQAVPGAS